MGRWENKAPSCVKLLCTPTFAKQNLNKQVSKAARLTCDKQPLPRKGKVVPVGCITFMREMEKNLLGSSFK